MCKYLQVNLGIHIYFHKMSHRFRDMSGILQLESIQSYLSLTHNFLNGYMDNIDCKFYIQLNMFFFNP